MAYLSKENREPMQAMASVESVPCFSVYAENVKPGTEVLINDNAPIRVRLTRGIILRSPPRRTEKKEWPFYNRNTRNGWRKSQRLLSINEDW